MKLYSRHSVAKLALAGLSLICLMTMLAPSAYAQYPHKSARSVTLKHQHQHQHSAAEVEKYISPATTVYKDKSHVSNISLLANQSLYHEITGSTKEHHANELFDENNHDDCCDICEDLLTDLSSSINNKTEDNRVLPVRYVKSISLFHTTTTIHTGFIDSFAPSPLQGTLRYRALLI
jgi:hypothetical protein